MKSGEFVIGVSVEVKTSRGTRRRLPVLAGASRSHGSTSRAAHGMNARVVTVNYYTRIT